jgi:methylated-DNA-protein-cysteine methyltransferase-like protein
VALWQAAGVTTAEHLAPQPFAAAVNAVVRAVPPGHVVSYGEVAAEVGRPGAARAVGTVLRRSEGLPWWRVVAATGRVNPHAVAEATRRLRAEGVEVRDGRVRGGTGRS